MEPWLEAFLNSATRRSAEVAHDLKTPLNIAVLNLELARLKLRKISEVEDDEPISAYLRAVELELRRIARIFDSYFVYSVPPAEMPGPELVDPAPVLAEVVGKGEIELQSRGKTKIRVHEDRLRVLLLSFTDGVRALLEPDTIRATATGSSGRWTLEVVGELRRADEELSKIFKFYYTDATGAPELGLATARLITETYGGSLDTRKLDGELALILTIPAGDE